MRISKTVKDHLFESDATKSEIVAIIEDRIHNHQYTKWNPVYYANRIYYPGFRITPEEIYIRNTFGDPIHIFIEDVRDGKTTITFEPVTGNRLIRIVVAIFWTIAGVSLYGSDIINGNFGIVTRIGLVLWGSAGLIIALVIFVREIYYKQLFKRYVGLIVSDLNRDPG